MQQSSGKCMISIKMFADPYGSGGGNSNYNSGHGSAPSMYNNQPHPHHQGVNPQQAMPGELDSCILKRGRGGGKICAVNLE